MYYFDINDTKILHSKHHLTIFFQIHIFIAIVGSWSGWSMWTSCSEACGEGVKIRERTCNNTSSEPGSVDCAIDGSSSKETLQCKLDPCISEILGFAMFF